MNAADLASRLDDASSNDHRRSVLIDGLLLKIPRISLTHASSELSKPGGVEFVYGEGVGAAVMTKSAGRWGYIAMGYEHLEIASVFGGVVLIDASTGSVARVLRMNLRAKTDHPSLLHVVGYCVVIALAIEWLASASQRLLANVNLQGSPPPELRPWFSQRR